MEPAAAVTLIAVVLVILALVVYLVAVILELRKITAGLDAVIESVGGILHKSEPVNASSIRSTRTSRRERTCSRGCSTRRRARTTRPG